MLLEASSPGLYIPVFNVKMFSVCNIEKLGVARGQGYTFCTIVVSNIEA